jgi:hypothetical protein
MYEDVDRPRKIGHLCIAIDPGRFAGAATLETQVDAIVKDLRTHGDILFPGEPELIEQEKRRRVGHSHRRGGAGRHAGVEREAGRQLSDGEDMKRELLMMGPMYPVTLQELENTYTVHKLWLAADRDALLASLADRHRLRWRLRGRRASTTRRWEAAQAQDDFALRRRRGFHRHRSAKRRGIMVSNTPDVLTDDVADIAMGLLIAVSRKLVVGDRYVREGKWLKGPMPLAESVQGKTLGICGMGASAARSRSAARRST